MFVGHALALFAALIATSTSVPAQTSFADDAPDAAQTIARSRLGPQSAQSGLIAANLDPIIRPQDDLWRHSNGAWLAKVPIPDGSLRWGIDDVMNEETLLQLRGLLEEKKPVIPGHDEDQARALYAAFMDQKTIESLGAKPLRAALDRIEQIRTIDELSTAMAELMQQSVRLPLTAYVTGDAKNSSRYAVYLSQSGLGLPDRDYYLGDDARSVAARTAYYRYLSAMLATLGDWDSNLAADRIVELETRLAQAQWTRADARDVVKTYNPLTAAQMGELSGGFFGTAFVRALGLDANARLILEQPSYLEELGKLSRSVKLSTWKSYLRWQLLASYAPYLSDAFVNPTFMLRGHLAARTRQLSPRWKRGVQLVDQHLGGALGRLYVARYFPSETRAKIAALVANIVAALRQSIDDSDWLSPSSKTEARAKLAKLHIRIGHPGQWPDYSKLSIDAGDLVGNVMRARMFNWRAMAARVGGPVDRDEFRFTPPTNNAVYNNVLNAAEFPAGLLQQPMFNANASDAYNYGAIGATIGHEIMHGFDDQGSRYDSDGNLRDWWTPDDRKGYEAKVEKLVAQFDRYEPVKRFRIDGRLTVGENLADLAGAEIAYKAYRLSRGGKPASIVEGHTGDQLFFLGYAQSLIRKQRAESTIAQLKSDPHSPNEFRVNGVVVNMPGFHEAFGVKPGDGMWLEPEKRVGLWR